MTEWYTNEFSKIAGISKRALHYYDSIDLLKPSARLSNGYRSYSGVDLLKLQQIIALRFFGFELNKIKTFMATAVDINELEKQLKYLEAKKIELETASSVLKKVISNYSVNKVIPWDEIIKKIDTLQPTKKTKKQKKEMNN